MKNWVKIQSFDRYHQADLRKKILNQNGINAVISDEKDSLFLLGNIELYVEEFNEKKARALIDEFEGLTKINSYVDFKPILLLQKVLQNAGIETVIKRKESNKYILDNYEMYVKNEEVEKVIPFLTGKSLDGWTNLMISNKLRQSKYFVDLLAENSVNTIIIKKKDTHYHLEAVVIYVKNEDYNKALKIVSDLKGFVPVAEADNLPTIEQKEEILCAKEIKGIIKKDHGKIKLYVRKDKEEEADKILANKAEWVLLKTYSSITNAMYHKSILDEAGIPSHILNDKDSSFLLGEIELYTEKSMLEKAQNTIANF